MQKPKCWTFWHCSPDACQQPLLVKRIHVVSSEGKQRQRGKTDASVTAMPHYSVNADWLHFTCSSSKFQIANLLLSHCFHCEIDKYVLIPKTFSNGHLLNVSEADSEQTLKLILSKPEKWHLWQWRIHRGASVVLLKDSWYSTFSQI